MQICVFHESSTWSQLTFGDFFCISRYDIFLRVWQKEQKNIVLYELYVYISNLDRENYELNKKPDNQKIFATLSWLAILSS